MPFSHQDRIEKSFGHLLGTSLPVVYEETHPLESLWQMLLFFLAKYDTIETNGRYHKAVAEQILEFRASIASRTPSTGEGHLLPPWLTDSFLVR